MSDLYETDVVAWSQAQAALQRRLASGEAVNEQLDWEHIVDEVETVGRSERSSLRSHIATVLEHLLKLAASPAIGPRNTVERVRVQIRRQLRDSPSLRREVAAMITDERPDCALLAASALRQHGEPPRVALASLAFTEHQVLGEWFPGDPA